MEYTLNAQKIEAIFGELVGLNLFKSWNIFATRIFYFAVPGFKELERDGAYMLTLECPWRIERCGRLLVGSEDYGLRAEDNLAPEWQPDQQSGSLQEQRLGEILGELRNGAVFNTGLDMIVESVHADSIGGFTLSLAGNYVLSTFPTSASQMEWLLSRCAGGNLALSCGTLSSTPPIDSEA